MFNSQKINTDPKPWIEWEGFFGNQSFQNVTFLENGGVHISHPSRAGSKPGGVLLHPDSPGARLWNQKRDGMTHTDPCPYQTYTATGSRGIRYASEHAAQNKARQIGGTYQYEPRN